MAKKSITIDDLARMIQKEFAEVDRQIKGLGKNIQRLDKNDQVIVRRFTCS